MVHVDHRERKKISPRIDKNNVTAKLLHRVSVYRPMMTTFTME